MFASAFGRYVETAPYLVPVYAVCAITGLRIQALFAGCIDE